MWYFSVYDFINFVTGREPGNEYAGNLFRRLVKPGSEHAEDIRSLWSDVKFRGQRQKLTACMTVRGLQRLLMLLGGKVAAQYREIREIVESVFTRYTAGDTSLRHGSEHVSNCHSFKIQGSRGHPGHSCVRYRKHADANTQQSQQSSTHSFPAPPSRTVPRTDHGSRPEIDRKCEPI